MPTKPERVRAMADRMDSQAEEKLRDRETNTPRKLKFAMSARLDGHRLNRAAEYARAYANALESDAVPPALDGLRPTRETFLVTARQKTAHVSNGYHGYLVETGEWADISPTCEALRKLADAGRTDEQQEADAQAERVEAVRLAEARLQNVPIADFFPTPRPVIDRMLAAADIRPGHHVLEPSAGKGDILDALCETYPVDHDTETQQVSIDAVEVVPALCEVLDLKGYAVIRGDFLEQIGPGWQGAYDRVVMNPPFGRRQDIAHIRHAYGMLRPGGRLVSIMSNGSLSSSGKRETAFRDWLESVGGEVVSLPADAFNGKSAFRRTGTHAVMVTIENEPAEIRQRCTNPPKADHVRDRQPALIETERVIPHKAQGPDLFKPKRSAPPRREVQKKLFAGLDCLPGQRDLFAVDGVRD